MCFSYIFEFKDDIFLVSEGESYSGTGVAISDNCIVVASQSLGSNDYSVKNRAGDSIEVNGVIGQFMGLKFLKAANTLTSGIEFVSVDLQVGDFISTAYTTDSGLIEFNSSQLVEANDVGFLLSNEQPNGSLAFSPSGGTIVLVSNNVEVISGSIIMEYYHSQVLSLEEVP